MSEWDCSVSVDDERGLTVARVLGGAREAMRERVDVRYIDVMRAPRGGYLVEVTLEVSAPASVAAEAAATTACRLATDVCTAILHRHYGKGEPTIRRCAVEVTA